MLGTDIKQQLRLLKLGFIGLFAVVVVLAIFSFTKPTGADSTTGTCLAINKGGTGCDLAAVQSYLGIDDIESQIAAIESRPQLADMGTTNGWQWEKYLRADGTRFWRGYRTVDGLSVTWGANMYRALNLNPGCLGNWQLNWTPNLPSGIAVSNYIGASQNHHFYVTYVSSSIIMVYSTELMSCGASTVTGGLSVFVTAIGTWTN